MKARVGGVSEESKKLLTTLAFHDAHKWSSSQQVDSRTGRFALNGGGSPPSQPQLSVER